jgi:hypothetical protein
MGGHLKKTVRLRCRSIVARLKNKANLPHFVASEFIGVHSWLRTCRLITILYIFLHLWPNLHLLAQFFTQKRGDCNRAWDFVMTFPTLCPYVLVAISQSCKTKPISPKRGREIVRSQRSPRPCGGSQRLCLLCALTINEKTKPIWSEEGSLERQRG